LLSLTPEHVRRRLLAGAATLLLGVARRGAATAAVVGHPALVPEPSVLAVKVPPAAHLPESEVGTPGRGKHNAFFLGGAFRKAKYEKLRRRKKKRRKRGRAKIPPPTLRA